jgi:hypothetical protein
MWVAWLIAPFSIPGPFRRLARRFISARMTASGIIGTALLSSSPSICRSSSFRNWPNGWDDDEPTRDAPLDTIYDDVSVQPALGGRWT